MTWTLTDDLGAYLAAAAGFLRSQPVRHTIQLSAVETLRARGASAFGETAPLFGWWRSGTGEITAALLHTPPYPVLLTRLPERSAQPLAEALAGCGRQLTGATSQESRRSRLFRLGRLRPPAPGPRGAARVATTANRALLESWLAAFAEEIGESTGPP